MVHYAVSLYLTTGADTAVFEAVSYDLTGVFACFWVKTPVGIVNNVYPANHIHKIEITEVPVKADGTPATD